MGQTARLRLIRDRFIAGHNSCELCRHLDSVSSETPMRDIVDRCWVWESHVDSDVRRASKPGPDPTFLTYMVSGPDRGVDDLWVTAVTTPQSTPDQFVDCWLVQLRRLRPRSQSPLRQSLTWMQTELDRLRTESKQCYQASSAAACSYCGKWIKFDMHRHVSTFHLELGQLWCCPVSWRTVWKGTPQDCMDHIRGAHMVSPEVKTACFGPIIPAVDCSARDLN